MYQKPKAGGWMEQNANNNNSAANTGIIQTAQP